MGNTLDFDPSTLPDMEPTSKEKNDKEAKDNFLTLMGDYFGRNMKNIANVMKDSPTMGMMPGVAFLHAREGVTNAQDARNAYLRQELGEDNYDPGVNTIKDFLDDTETNAGLQFAYGFADNIDEVRKGLASRLSKKPDGTDRRIEIYTDDRKDKPWYMPKFYTSVEDDNGIMTKYSNPLQTGTDFVARAIGQAGFDIASAAVDIAPAVGVGLATATVAGFMPFIGGAAALTLGPIAFLTTAYTMGVGTTKVKNDFLKPALGLTEKEAQSFLDFLKFAQDHVTKIPAYQFLEKKTPFLGTGEPFEQIADSVEEQINGYLSAGGLGIGRVFDKIKTAGESLMRAGGKDLEKMKDTKVTDVEFAAGLGTKESGKIDSYYNPVNIKTTGDIQVFRQMVNAQAAVNKTRQGERFGFLNVPFNDFVLDMYTPSRIISRLSKLAQQTSLVIPNKIKESNNKLTAFIQSYMDMKANGTVSYKAFKEPFDKVRTYYESIAENKKNEFSKLGLDVKDLDEAFDTLRYMENKVMYDNAFQILGDATYDLSPLRTQLGKLTKNKVIKPIYDTEGIGAGDIIDYKVKKTKTFHLDNIIKDLRLLGGKRKADDPTAGELDIQQIKTAVNKFFKANADYLPQGADGEKLRAEAVKTPAKLLHTYAVVLGKIAYQDYKGLPGKERFEGADIAFKDAMSLRDTLLEMLSKPKVGNKKGEVNAEDLKEAKTLLTDANKFYSETLKIRGLSDSGSSFMDRLRLSLGKREHGVEYGTLMEELLGAGGKPPRRGAGVITLGNMKKQQEYFLDKINEFDVSKDFLDKYGRLSNVYTDLQDDFAHTLFQTLGYNTKTKLTDPASPSFVVEFFNSMDANQKALLGIDKNIEAYFKQTAEDFEFIFNKKLMDILKEKGPNVNSNELFNQVFDSAEIDTNISRLIGRIAQENKVPSNLKDISKSNRVAASPFEQSGEAEQKIRTGLLNYLFDPNSPSGVFAKAKANTALFDAGNIYIDMDRFVPLMDKIRASRELSTILTPMDKEFLDIIENIGYAMQGAGKADAGTALAGAQIIGELFTIDGRKLLGGLGRLAAQDRLSKLFTNDRLINFLIGTAPTKRKVGYIERLVFGKGAMADLVTQIVRDIETKSEEEVIQPNEITPEIFENAPGFSRLNEQTDKLIKKVRTIPPVVTQTG